MVVSLSLLVCHWLLVEVLCLLLVEGWDSARDLHLTDLFSHLLDLGGVHSLLLVVCVDILVDLILFLLPLLIDLSEFLNILEELSVLFCPSLDHLLCLGLVALGALFELLDGLLHVPEVFI